MIIKKITQTILCFTLLIGFSVISQIQAQGVFATETSGGVLREDKDCLDINNYDGDKPFQLDLSILTGLNSFTINGLLGANITIGDETTAVGFKGKVVRTKDISHNIIKNKNNFFFKNEHLEFLTECVDGVQFLELKIELTITENGVTRILTGKEVSLFLNTDFLGDEEIYSETIQIPICCDDINGAIGDGLIENRSANSINTFKIINQPTYFELILDNTFNNKYVDVSVYDLAGRELSKSSHYVQNYQNSILVNKPFNRLGMYLLSISTEDQMITKKIINY